MLRLRIAEDLCVFDIVRAMLEDFIQAVIICEIDEARSVWLPSSQVKHNDSSFDLAELLKIVLEFFLFKVFRQLGDVHLKKIWVGEFDLQFIAVRADLSGGT